MAGFVKVDGLEELRRQIAEAPEDVKDRARQIVRQVTESAASEMTHRYPVGKTGNLRSSVKTSYPSGGDRVIGIAQNTASHSHLFEFGTRRRRTSRGADRGRMPSAAPEIAVPIAQRWRRIMIRDLIAMLRTKGFTVTETP